jgi:hypothetical protein
MKRREEKRREEQSRRKKEREAVGTRIASSCLVWPIYVLHWLLLDAFCMDDTTAIVSRSWPCHRLCNTTAVDDTIQASSFTYTRYLILKKSNKD